MMTKDNFLRYGFIVVGACLICGGFYELLSGNYVPTGHRNGAFKRLFKLIFIEFGPAVHSLTWFVLGGAFIGAGFLSFKTPHKQTNLEKFSGQKPRILGKK